MASYELYEFRTTLPQSWFYTDGRGNVTTDPGTPISQVWTRLQISHDELALTVEESELDVTMPFGTEPASLYKAVAPTNVLSVFISDSAQATIFTGKLVAIRFLPGKKDEALMTFKSISHILSGGRSLLRYSPTCNLTLYGPRCGVSKDGSSPDSPPITFKATITWSTATVDGTDITHADFGDYPDGWFAGGWATKGEESVMITGHTGTTISVIRAFQDPTDGDLVLLRGCRLRPIEDCDAIFGNRERFLGFAFVPDRNPAEVGL